MLKYHHILTSFSARWRYVPWSFSPLKISHLSLSFCHLYLYLMIFFASYFVSIAKRCFVYGLFLKVESLLPIYDFTVHFSEVWLFLFLCFQLYNLYHSKENKQTHQTSEDCFVLIKKFTCIHLMCFIKTFVHKYIMCFECVHSSTYSFFLSITLSYLYYQGVYI